jgi:hypothetical protein
MFLDRCCVCVCASFSPCVTPKAVSLPPPCASGNAVVANQFTNRQQRRAAVHGAMATAEPRQQPQQQRWQSPLPRLQTEDERITAYDAQLRDARRRGSPSPAAAAVDGGGGSTIDEDLPFDMSSPVVVRRGAVLSWRRSLAASSLDGMAGQQAGGRRLCGLNQRKFWLIGLLVGWQLLNVLRHMPGLSGANVRVVPRFDSTGNPVWPLVCL